MELDEVVDVIDVLYDFASCADTPEGAAGDLGVAGRVTSVTVVFDTWNPGTEVTGFGRFSVELDAAARGASTGREGGQVRPAVGVSEGAGASTREGVLGIVGERGTLPLESRPGEGTLVSG